MLQARTWICSRAARADVAYRNRGCVIVILTAKISPMKLNAVKNLTPSPNHSHPMSHDVTRTLSLTACNDDEVMCPSGVCIHEDWVCDFYNDCGDRWDEQDCFSATDSPPVFPTEDPESYNSTGYCK